MDTYQEATIVIHWAISRLPKHMVRMALEHYGTRDEIAQQALILFWRKWTKGTDLRLTTIATHSARYAVLHGCDRRGFQRDRDLQLQSIRFVEGYEHEWPNLDGPEWDTLPLDRLRQRERDILEKRRGGQQIKQIAKAMGLSKQRVSQLQSRAVRHLQEMVK